jgi:hypothetical protein
MTRTSCFSVRDSGANSIALDVCLSSFSHSIELMTSASSLTESDDQEKGESSALRHAASAVITVVKNAISTALEKIMGLVSVRD